MVAMRSTGKNHPEAMQALLATLCQSAARFVAPAKIDKTLHQWLGGGRHLNVGNPELVLAEAVALVLDFTLFAPSASGKTAIDRFARQYRAVDSDEEAALKALRRSRFHVMEIQDPHPNGGVWAKDLGTDERCQVIDSRPWIELKGEIIGARLAPIEPSVLMPVGPVTSVDLAGLAIVEGRLANPHRCAEAFYRHIVRCGGREIAGFKREARGESRRFPFAASDGPLHALAFQWAADGAEGDLSAGNEQIVRESVNEQALIEILLASTLAKERSMSAHALAYRRLLTLQLETILLRGATGMAAVLSSLADVEDLLEQAITVGSLPDGARSVFAAARQHLQAAGHQTGKADADLDKVLARIRALRLKTVDRGCTEEEAMAAAAKVASLLDRYGLSLDEVRLKSQSAEGFGVDTGRRRRGPVDGCLPVIGLFCDCRVWTEQDQDGQLRYIFFGLPADIEGANYLYELIEQVFATETQQFKQSDLYADHHSSERRSATHAFQTGLAQGIGQKLEHLRAEREATRQTTAGRDLVMVKGEVIDQDLARLGLHFKTQKNSRRRRSVLKDAYQPGQEAGDRFTYRPDVTEGPDKTSGGRPHSLP